MRPIRTMRNCQQFAHIGTDAHHRALVLGGKDRHWQRQLFPSSLDGEYASAKSQVPELSKRSLRWAPPTCGPPAATRPSSSRRKCIRSGRARRRRVSGRHQTLCTRSLPGIGRAKRRPATWPVVKSQSWIVRLSDPETAVRPSAVNATAYTKPPPLPVHASPRWPGPRPPPCGQQSPRRRCGRRRQRHREDAADRAPPASAATLVARSPDPHGAVVRASGDGRAGVVRYRHRVDLAAVPRQRPPPPRWPGP